jgi:hypothetical protein
MRVHVICTDGYEFEACPVYNWNRTLIYDTANGYLIIPWEDVEKSYVTLEDFQEAQRAAKEDRLGEVMADFKKANMPVHEEHGIKFREVR